MKDIQKITKKLREVEKKIEEKNKSIEALEKVIEESKVSQFEDVVKVVESKIETFENNLYTLKKCLGEKDSIITVLENKVSELEAKICEITHTQEEKISELVLKVSILESNNLDDKVTAIEEKQNYLIEEAKGKYTCNYFDFSTYYRKGLKIHKKKMHKSHSCELCEEIFDTARDLKIHAYTHSYTTENKKEKCNNCDFQCNTVYTMEVHLGKCREENFECGLCEANFLKVSDLEIHIKSCEIYECGKCWIRDKSLSDMKNHITEKHQESTVSISYLKMDRNSENEVNTNYYSLSEV